MEDVFEKSLRLQQEHLDNISDEDFLKLYNEIEKQCNPNGITIEEYLKHNKVDYERN